MPDVSDAIGEMVERELARIYAKRMSEIGRKGGSVKSDRKAASSRENGKKGGHRVVDCAPFGLYIADGTAEDGTA